MPATILSPEELSLARHVAKLTMRELAGICDMRPNTVCAYENGKDCRTSTAIALSAAVLKRVHVYEDGHMRKIDG